MPPHASCRSRESTASTTAEELFMPKPSAQKRKITTLTPRASAEPSNAKRIKTESKPPIEPETSRPVGAVIDSVYDTIVTIKVGKDGRSFGIHRGLLRRASEFFREGLASSDTTVIVLKEEQPAIFNRFNLWLYTNSIISKAETNKKLAWSSIIALYTFASRLGIPSLQNHCIDTTILKIKEGGLFPAPIDINTLFKTTPVNNKAFRLQNLLLDLFASKCNLKDVIFSATTAAVPYHPSFLEGLILSLYKLKERRKIYQQIDFWKGRQVYYVDDRENPIVLE